MPCCASHRSILQFLPGAHTAEHQSAAAHVASPDEFLREMQPVGKYFDQHVHVLARADAAKEHDAQVWMLFCNAFCIAEQRTAVALVLRIDVHPRESLQLGQKDRLIRRNKAAIGCNDVSTVQSVRRRRERAGVSELAAEVEPADEREDLAERDSLRAVQLTGQRKLGARIQNELGALAAGMGRRKQKDFGHRGNYEGAARLQPDGSDSRESAQRLCASKSRISPRSFSCGVGPGAGTGFASSFRRSLFMALTIMKMQNARMIKFRTMVMKFP